MASAPIDLCQLLSRSGVQNLPTRFHQPLSRRPSSDQSTVGQSIPVVDFASSEENISEEIARACQEWGFFQVVNHGIPASLLEKVQEVVNGFLDLPMDEKLKRPMKHELHNPTGYGRLFDFSKDSVLDWVDALRHYLAPPGLKDEDYWPESPPDYRETVEAYGIQVQRLARTILASLSGSLGLAPNYLEEAFGGDDARLMLQVNHYPRCPQADLVLGVSPHSDGTAITILLCDEVKGLQVRKDGRWCTVEPLPGALIVNMGDMMQLISNGKFLSVEHRAVVNKDSDRISIVVFYEPSVDAVIGPAAPPDDHTHRPIYKSIKYGDYTAIYMNNEINGKSRIESLLLKPT